MLLTNIQNPNAITAPIDSTGNMLVVLSCLMYCTTADAALLIADFYLPEVERSRQEHSTENRCMFDVCRQQCTFGKNRVAYEPLPPVLSGGPTSGLDFIFRLSQFLTAIDD